MSKNRLDSKMLREYLFNFFMIKMPRSVVALEPFDILIVKKLNTKASITIN